jgi:hypothetical protein
VVSLHLHGVDGSGREFIPANSKKITNDFAPGDIPGRRDAGKRSLVAGNGCSQWLPPTAGVSPLREST